MMQIKDGVVASDDTAMCFNYAFDEPATSLAKDWIRSSYVLMVFGFQSKHFFPYEIHERSGLVSTDSLAERSSAHKSCYELIKPFHNENFI